MEKLLTIKEMAAMLSMSWRGVQELTKRRQIPVVRLGRSIRYAPGAVERAIEKLTVRSI